jgi:hypothetical protein
LLARRKENNLATPIVFSAGIFRSCFFLLSFLSNIKITLLVVLNQAKENEEEEEGRRKKKEKKGS